MPLPGPPGVWLCILGWCCTSTETSALRRKRPDPGACVPVKPLTDHLAALPGIWAALQTQRGASEAGQARSHLTRRDTTGPRGPSVPSSVQEGKCYTVYPILRHQQGMTRAFSPNRQAHPSVTASGTQVSCAAGRMLQMKAHTCSGWFCQDGRVTASVKRIPQRMEGLGLSSSSSSWRGKGVYSPRGDLELRVWAMAPGSLGLQKTPMPLGLKVKASVSRSGKAAASGH